MTGSAAVHTWEALLQLARPSPDEFDITTLKQLPEPAQRLLGAALPDGAPLHNGVELEMRGRIKLGPWLPFTAHQLLVAGAGFVWLPVVGPRLFRVVGADVLGPKGGRMGFRLYGRIPVAVGSGPDVSRSAAGRLAAETVAWLPQALTPQAGASWQPIDDDRAAVTLEGPDGPTKIEVTVDESGNLVELQLQRWNDRTRPPGHTPFGGAVTGFFATVGVRIAGNGSVGWRHGSSDGGGSAFFEYTITGARFLGDGTTP